MVEEADVRQDGNIDYKCLCSYLYPIDLNFQTLYSRVQQIFNWKREEHEEAVNTTKLR